MDARREGKGRKGKRRRQQDRTEENTFNGMEAINKSRKGSNAIIP